MATRHLSAPTLPAVSLQVPAVRTLLLAVLLCAQAALCWTARSRTLAGQVDLRAFYSAGTMVRAGEIGAIYDDHAEEQVQQAIFHDGGRTLHFLYPMFAALPCLLLATVPYRAAFFLVVAVDLLCLFLCCRLLARAHSEWKLRVPLLFAAALASLPAVIALMQGQISFLLLLIFTAAYLLERQRPALAGLCLSLALVKFQVVLPVVLLYACWRRWKVIAGFLAGSAGLVLLTLLLAGADGVRAYAGRLHGVGASTLLDAAAAHQRYGMQVAKEPNLHGLAIALAGQGRPALVGTLALSAVVLLWAALRGRQTVATALPAALLVSYHLQPYDLLLLLLPLCLLLGSPASGRAAGVGKALLCASVVLLVAPVGYLLLREAPAWLALASLCVLLAAGLRRAQPGCVTEAVPVLPPL